MELRQAGGRAAAKSKHNKKIIGDALKDILGREISDEKIRARLKKLGLTDEEMVYSYAMAFSVVNKAIVNGDAKALSIIRDTIGEMPIKQIDVTRHDDEGQNQSLREKLANALLYAQDLEHKALMAGKPPEIVEIVEVNEEETKEE